MDTEYRELERDASTGDCSAKLRFAFAQERIGIDSSKTIESMLSSGARFSDILLDAPFYANRWINEYKNRAKTIIGGYGDSYFKEEQYVELADALATHDINDVHKIIAENISDEKLKNYARSCVATAIAPRSIEDALLVMHEISDDRDKFKTQQKIGWELLPKDVRLSIKLQGNKRVDCDNVLHQVTATEYAKKVAPYDVREAIHAFSGLWSNTRAGYLEICASLFRAGQREKAEDMLVNTNNYSQLGEIRLEGYIALIKTLCGRDATGLLELNL